VARGFNKVRRFQILSGEIHRHLSRSYWISDDSISIYRHTILQPTSTLYFVSMPSIV